MSATREQPRWRYIQLPHSAIIRGKGQDIEVLTPEYLNGLESELVALRLQAKIGSAVVAAYRHNPVVVAEVCDEALDQSGALLDWVHAAAKEYPHE